MLATDLEQEQIDAALQICSVKQPLENIHLGGKVYIQLYVVCCSCIANFLHLQPVVTAITLT